MPIGLILRASRCRWIRPTETFANRCHHAETDHEEDEGHFRRWPILGQGVRHDGWRLDVANEIDHRFGGSFAGQSRQRTDA